MSGCCRVRHCGEPTTSRYSPYCRRHKSTRRRQGDPTQTAIGATELKPFRDRVKARIEKNQDNPLWEHLDALWGTIAAQARNDAERQTGNRYQRSAAHELLNISADNNPREIVVTTLAMFVLWHDMPWRFRSDAAFRLQLARRVRALTSRHTGLIYDHATGKHRRVYREMTPKAGNIIGQKLSSAFGAAGFQLALLDERERDEVRKAKDAIANAIKELK
ncbi:hypothetical protein [Aminobacter sp. BE322]|uniref:hypothetical protein n=1 Tax=unclassified Aminobacter TaxID=2644704 RepID=UPI003D2483AB